MATVGAFATAWFVKQMVKYGYNYSVSQSWS